MNGAAPELRPASTFFGAPVSDLEDLQPGDVAAVGVYCDHFSAGRPGGRFAARQLRYSSTGSNAPVPRAVVDLGDFNVFPLEPQRTQDILSEQSQRVVASGAKLLALGGDYSVSPAFVKGLTAHYNTTSIGLIRISRRLDLLPVERKPSNGPWRCSATSEIATVLSAGSSAIALLGARGDVAREESDRISEMTVIPAAEVALKPGAAAAKARSALAAVADRFFLSVDVDVLEPRFGTVALPRARGGLSLEQLLAVLAVFNGMPFIGAELTGHVPDLDVPGRMATALMSGIAVQMLDCLSAQA